MGTRVDHGHTGTGTCVGGPLGFFWFRASTLWGMRRRPSSCLGAHPQSRSNLTCEKDGPILSKVNIRRSELLTETYRLDKPACQTLFIETVWLGGYLGQTDVSGKVSYAPPPTLLCSFSENDFYLFNFMVQQNQEIILTTLWP